MNSSSTLANRLKEVLTEGTWVTGTNYKAEIEEMDWEDATRSMNNLNSVALLTFHINYYLDGVSRFFEGGNLDISDAFSFNAPPVNSEKDWIDLKEQFYSNATRFIRLVEKMSESQLQSIFVDPKYGTYQRNVDVMIEHAYYHLGQIVIIKKMLRDNKDS